MSSSAQHFVQFISDFTLAVSILGVILSVLLLAAIAYLQWNPVSRPHIDRVSFRLVIYGLGANVVLGFMTFPSMKETTPGCSLLAFFGVALPMLSASMFCCIALNLQLVLVYGVNGNMMEKYYVLGAVFLSGACAIPPFAAGELGWYAMDGVCWLRDSTPAVQLHWLIGTQSVPMLLMSSLEVFSFVNILIFMIRHEACFHLLERLGDWKLIPASPDTHPAPTGQITGQYHNKQQQFLRIQNYYSCI
ncbi:hypothetical protein B0H13DRAFT_2574694 [Mycena leptocephala]|nr:hypothetical protein B0H13DRAFT_2574694 [Mycena leptocephala]